MNKNNNLPEAIPNTQSQPMVIDCIGNVTKKRFLGEFTCHIPTIKEQADIAKYEAILNGEFPVYLSPGVLKMHKMIAYLRYTLDETPLFWRNADNGYSLRDPNVIEDIYEKVLKFEGDWYNVIWGEEPAGEDENGSEEPEEEKKA